MDREDWIDPDLAERIQEVLDEQLKTDNFQNGIRDAEEEAALFFQEELFDRFLGFNRVTAPAGQQSFESIPVYDWPESARAENAYLIVKND